ncbi:MAG TPA: sialidase family protein [Micromonosporaceae bacterium]
MPEFEPIQLVGVDAESSPDVIESGPDRRWEFPGYLATVAVLAALTVIAVGAPEPRPPTSRPATSPGPLPTIPRGQPSPVSIHFPPVVLDLPGEVRFLDMGPTGYTAVTAFDCTAAGPCVGSLAVSDDLWRWERRSLPDGAFKLRTPMPMVLGHGALLIESNARDTMRRWHSGDGGRSWRSVPTRRSPPVPDASAGRVVVDRAGSLSRRHCGPGVVSVIRSDTGRLAPLRQQPALQACEATPFPDPAGRLWVAVLDPVSGGPAVAMSSDAGRSWSTAELPGVAGHSLSVSISYVGSDVYAVVVGALPNPRFTIFRYTDRGWTPTWRTTGTEPENMEFPVVCPDGLLLSASWEGGHLLRNLQLLFSVDHGRNWHLAARKHEFTVKAVPLNGSSAWYGWYGGESPRPVVSGDCRHWGVLPVS